MDTIHASSEAGMGGAASLVMEAKTHLPAALNHHYKVEHYQHYHADGTRCTIPANQRIWGRSLFQRISLWLRHWGDVCSESIHTPVLAWQTEFDNLVVTAGLNKYLDATLKTGLASPLWYVGLVDNASWSAYAAGDVMSSHAGWLEGQPYSNATRPAFTPGTISAASVDNSASKAVFNINATLTVRGAFVCDNAVKAQATGILFGEGDYTNPRTVYSGDTLNVTITSSLTST